MRVLIADDSATMLRMLDRTLSGWGYEVVQAHDGEEALEILSSDDPPPLAVLDWVMPRITGPEVCERVRALKGRAYTYILLVTAKGQLQDLVEGMGAGADDYIVKPVENAALEVRLRAGRRIIELQTELIKAQEALRDQATRDALTHCWNRFTLFEILAREISRSHREKRPLGLIMLDLDHFKQVNDTHGHLRGDEVLKQLVKRVEGSMRTYDTLGRYGGEEFVCVLPGCDAEAVKKHAERMRTAVESAPVVFEDAEIRITSSFGAVSGIPGPELTPDELVHVADDALYRAKRGGRNCVSFSSY
jgi:diguanylate cyclase (GGDEF)-like protein